jgi:hypothetical protein
MNALIGKHSPYGNSYGNQDAYKVVRRSTHTFATCAAAAGNRLKSEVRLGTRTTIIRPI